MDEDDTYSLKSIVFKAANRYYVLNNQNTADDPWLEINGVSTEEAIKQMINRYPRVKPHLLLYQKAAIPLSVKSRKLCRIAPTYMPWSLDEDEFSIESEEYTPDVIPDVKQPDTKEVWLSEVSGSFRNDFTNAVWNVPVHEVEEEYEPSV